MKFWTKTKGAVSVFLALILVPMTMISSLYVDASKVYLGKSVVESAGDLALNTALTQYDTKLKDLYGLFATAQDTDELYESLEEYYKTCITSSGVGEKDAESYTDLIMEQLGLVAKEDQAADLLNMQLVDFEVSKNKDATLANPTVMEKQIVDFMKYRAPINTGLSFLSSMQSFSTLSEQTDLVDKRKVYYEKENDVMKLLKEAWDNINEYNGLDLIKEDDYFDQLSQSFKETGPNSWKNIYQTQINKKVIMDLYDTQDHVDFNRNRTSCTSTGYTAVNGNYVYEDVWKIAETSSWVDRYNDGTYSKSHLPSKTKIKNLMTTYETNFNKVNSYWADFSSDTPPADVYDLQYLVQSDRKGLTNFWGAYVNWYNSYNQLKSAMTWAQGYESEDLDDIKNTKLKFAGRPEITIESYFSEVEGHFGPNGSGSKIQTYSTFFNMMADISEDVISHDKTNTSEVNSKAEEIGKKAKSYYETLIKGAEKLEAASAKIKEAVESVQDGGDLANAKSEWKAASEGSKVKDTSMAKQDQAEIAHLNTSLNVEDMNKMTKRLDTVAEKLRLTAEEVKKHQFDGKFIGDLQSYEDVKSAIRDKVGDTELKHVSLDTTTLISQANGWFQWDNGSISISWIHQSGKQPKLHGTDTDKLNFYSYLYTHFNKGEVSASTEKKEEDKDNGEKLYDNIKGKSSDSSSEKADEADKGSISNDSEIKNLSGKPSEQSSEEIQAKYAEVKTDDSAAKSTSTSLGAMFSNLSSALTDMGTDLRDKLYVSDYVLSMFSYDTIENEFKVKNSGKEVKLQTLTLTPINADHNYAYGKEVEYIIYGGKNAENLTKAYGSIFGIRFGFNVIYAFMDSSIRDSAFAIATPISAATLGVIPVPLIQAAIIIGIACCESAIDLVDLKNGEKVPLFKTSDTWHCSVKGLINEAKGLAGEAVKKVGGLVIDEGYEEISKLLDMTDEELTKYMDTASEEVKNKLVNYTTNSYDDLITKNADIAIQKLTTSAQNAINKLGINSDTTVISEIETGLDNWIASEAAGTDTDNDMAYLAKKKAVEVIKADCIPGFVAELKKSIEGSGETVDQILNTSADDVVDGMSGKVMDYIKRIRDKISNAINTGVDSISKKLKSYKEEAVTKLKTSLGEGASSLKDTLNESVDKFFGSGGGKSDKTGGISSLLSFAYSDYLRLFLMIGLYTDEQGVLLRTADVIQANMAKKEVEDDNYSLFNSSVYVDIQADVQVKPILLAMPLFADVENNPTSNTNWYTIRYKNVKGY